MEPGVRYRLIGPPTNCPGLSLNLTFRVHVKGSHRHTSRSVVKVMAAAYDLGLERDEAPIIPVLMLVNDTFESQVFYDLKQEVRGSCRYSFTPGLIDIIIPELWIHHIEPWLEGRTLGSLGPELDEVLRLRVRLSSTITLTMGYILKF